MLNPLFLSSDVRIGTCFAKIEKDRCVKNTGKKLIKAECCCSGNAGWGVPCELCPEKNTKEFELYCPDGIGFFNRTGK